MTLSLIAALANNRVIGKNGGMPWHIPEDLRYFKRVTLGKPIIMGRKTFDSIGRPLPGRDNIVVSRNPKLSVEGARVTHSLQEALDFATDLPSEEVFVIGGAQLYAAVLPDADKLYLTYVDTDVEGDTFFPAFDRGEWREFERHDHYSDKARLAFSFVVLERVT